MSSCSRITDDEMRYYQFKARQHFLIKKEDHEWNEFCKKKKCTCCSCQPSSTCIIQKDANIQTVHKVPPKLNQNTAVKNVQENKFSETLNDIKTKLEKLSVAVFDKEFSYPIPEKKTFRKHSADSKLPDQELVLNLLTEQRQNLIRSSILSSLQRLHSFASQKSTKPLSLSSARTKSFFLPPDLQRQRLIARNAYLESLVKKPKVAEKTKIKPIGSKTKTPIEKRNKKMPSQNLTSKASKSRVDQKLKPNEEKTLIQQEVHPERDENIENVIDGIVDDLLGEELLSLNRIKCTKFEKQNSASVKVKDTLDRRLTAAEKKEIHLSQPSLELRTKIKQIPFFHITKSDDKKFSSIDDSSKNLTVKVEKEKKNLCLDTVHDENVSEKPVNLQLPSVSNDGAISKKSHYKLLNVDPKLIKDIKKQRKLYFQYLEKVSRTRNHSFDPVTLTNMVAESLFDDCILDVCKELGDVPNSLILHLYNQEFTPML